MPEIANLNDAKARIEALFEPKSGAPATIMDDYAKIAWYLTNSTNQGPSFVSGMEAVSKQLWDVYRDYFQRFEGRMRNLFTSAIRDVAIRNGWVYGSDDNVVLVYAVTAQQYMDWVSKGVLFKDMMDVKHGEHSHTFQWLAIAHDAQAIQLTHPACYLYKNTALVKPKNKAELILPKEKHPTGKQGISDQFDLFAWLADCFPIAMAHSCQDPGGESIFSDSFRSPQAVTKYLIEDAPADHFVANYLRYRYKKRQWLPGNTPKTEYKDISGTSSKTQGMTRHQNDPAWTPVGGDKHEVAGFTRTGSRRFYTKEEFEKRKFIKVRFHNKDGFLSDPGPGMA